MVAARKRENQNRINHKIHLFFYGKKILQYVRNSLVRQPISKYILRFILEKKKHMNVI